jgi:hypothetical protein
MISKELKEQKAMIKEGLQTKEDIEKSQKDRQNLLEKARMKT